MRCFCTFAPSTPRSRSLEESRTQAHHLEAHILCTSHSSRCHFCVFITSSELAEQTSAPPRHPKRPAPADRATPRAARFGRRAWRFLRWLAGLVGGLAGLVGETHRAAGLQASGTRKAGLPFSAVLVSTFFNKEGYIYIYIKYNQTQLLFFC